MEKLMQLLTLLSGEAVLLVLEIIKEIRDGKLSPDEAVDYLKNFKSLREEEESAHKK